MQFAKSIFKAGVILPLLIGLLSKIFLWSYLRTLGCTGWDPHCWVRWDSGLYLDIAANGTSLFPCSWGEGKLWCGNAGWAPLYSWLMRICAWLTSGSLEACGVWISTVFYFGYLILAAKLTAIENYQLKNWLLLLLFAFCPGFIYFHAVFPVAQTAFFLMLTVWGFKENKYWLGGLGAIGAFFSYSSGVLIVIPIALVGIVKLLQDRIDFKHFLIQLVLPVLAGFFLLHFYYFIQTGHWNAMYLAQAKYGQGVYMPWEMVYSHWRSFLGNYTQPKGIIEMQTFTVSILVILQFIMIGADIRSRDNRALVFYFIGFLLAFWVAPFCLGPEVSLYRSCAFLGITQILWARKDNYVLALLLVIYFVFSLPMISWFYDKTLV